MDKKKITWTVILVICVLLICKFFIIGMSFNELMIGRKNSITKVFMRNGNGGSCVETSDKTKINELINALSHKSYRVSLNQIGRVGYSYFYDFYINDIKLLRITGDGDNVEVNDIYYNVSNPISIDKLNDWFNSLPASK